MSRRENIPRLLTPVGFYFNRLVKTVVKNIFFFRFSEQSDLFKKEKKKKKVVIERFYF